MNEKFENSRKFEVGFFQLLNFVHHVELIKFSSISGVEKGPGVSWECKMSFCSMMSRVIVF
jgi:hypothetical protein